MSDKTTGLNGVDSMSGDFAIAAMAARQIMDGSTIDVTVRDVNCTALKNYFDLAVRTIDPAQLPPEAQQGLGQAMNDVNTLLTRGEANMDLSAFGGNPLADYGIKGTNVRAVCAPGTFGMK